MQSQNGRDPMSKEIQALEQNHTPLRLGKKLIGFNWIYKIKYIADGSIK